MHFDLDTYRERSIEMGWFNWERIDNYGQSMPSREQNLLQLWTRTTIPWSLQCEDSLTRAEAF